jgi:flagella basal body P-ring formation protein FlgA
MMAMVLAAALGCVEVDADRITAGDLARAVPAFSALAAQTPLAYAPAPGSKRVMGRGELNRLGARHGLAVSATEEVCLVRKARRLDRQAVLEALRASLGRPEASIELAEWSAFPVPAGRLEFPRSGLRPPPAADPSRGVLWHGSIRTSEGRSYPVWARVKITVPCTRLVAVERLPAGRPIRAEQLAEQRFESCLLEEDLSMSAEEAAGKIPKRTIRQGAAVSRSWLEPAPEVERGQTVQVEASYGGVRLTTTARAESSGRTGQQVRVKNLDNGRLYRATVTGKSTVAAIQGGAQWNSAQR